MMMHRFLFVLPVLSAALLAQKIEFKTPPTQDQPLRYSLQTKLKTTETGKTLVNGAEPEAGGAGGRGGGGGGEMSLAQEIVFDEGPSSAPWRDYKTVAATQTRPGRDGTPQETKTEGGLQGKKVTLKTGDDGKVKFAEGEGDKQADVAAALVRGVPGRISFQGFLPDHGVATGEEFDVAKSFLPALRNLAHAVNRAPTEDAGGAAGGGQGGRGQGGRGQGGRGQGGGNVVLQLLSGGKFDVDAKGKVTGVDNDIATLAIKAKLTGKGTNEEMGIMGGGFGGAGGRGQGGGAAGGGAAAPAGTSKVDASFDLTGTVRFDLKAQRVVGVEFTGDLQVARESSSRMPDRNGEEQKIDRTSQSKGKVELKATCEAVAAK
ncbi:MAG TPA: hypothetical protein VFD82_04600 [Planctomycetota bacterium]|nr:hypothetical protein [Planctomycetota bacterium]